MGCASSKHAGEVTSGTKPAPQPGATATVTVNPALHPAKAATEASRHAQPPKPSSPLDPLAHIADQDPAQPLVAPLDGPAPTSEDVEACWRECELKHVYLEHAAEILADYFEERLQHPAASVTAFITGLLKLYKEAVTNLDTAADVQQQREKLFQLMASVAEADKRSFWVAKQLAYLYSTLNAGLRVLGPSFVEPIEHLHQQTNRPTPDAKLRVRKAVARRLAFMAHRAKDHKQVLETLCTALLDTKVSLQLAPETCNLTLGPRSSFNSQLWYAFAAKLPETCSWRFFQKQFVEFEFWPKGVTEIVEALKLRDANAPAWEMFKKNIQGEKPTPDVMLFEISTAFPQELLGLRMVGALKRMFVLPNYQLPGRDTDAAGASHTVLHKLAREVDRARRENNMAEVAEQLWNIIERLWYMDEAPQAALDEGIGSRALAVLELSHRLASIAYLPAAVIVCQLGPELAMEKAHVQRVGLAAKKLATGPKMQDSNTCIVLLALARAVLLTQGCQTWPAALGAENPADWDEESNPLNLTLTFTHIIALLHATNGHDWKALMHQADIAAPAGHQTGPLGALSHGLVRFQLQLRRLVLQTLFALSRFKDLRRYYGIWLPGLVDENEVNVTVEGALRAVEKKGIVDEKVLAKLVLDELTKPATEAWHSRQFSVAHSRDASILSRRSVRSAAHSRTDSLDVSKLHALPAPPSPQPPPQPVEKVTAHTPPMPEEKPKSAKANLPPPIPLATAERAAWRQQKFSYTADMFKPLSQVASPTGSARSEPHSFATTGSAPQVYMPSTLAPERFTPTRRSGSPSARPARKRAASASVVRPPWVDPSGEVSQPATPKTLISEPDMDEHDDLVEATKEPEPAAAQKHEEAASKRSSMGGITDHAWGVLPVNTGDAATRTAVDEHDLPSPVTPLPEHVESEFAGTPAYRGPEGSVGTPGNKDFVNPVFAPGAAGHDDEETAEEADEKLPEAVAEVVKEDTAEDTAEEQ